MFVLDFANAFWQIPLAVQERRHLIGYDGVKLWKFRRSAQGSGNGPLPWAGPSSLLFWCTQAVFTGMSSQVKFPEARSQVYVDDPAIVVRGTAQQRDEFVAVAVLVWRLLGFDLSFQKAQRGTTTVTWIGGLIEVKPHEVIVSIPREKIEDLLEIVNEMLGRNVVSVRAVRQLAGKSNHFASLVYA